MKQDYEPHFLPCGKYARNIYTSCSTECPHFSNEMIEQCYTEHKRKLIKTMKKFFRRKINEDEWYIYKNIYFTCKLKKGGGFDNGNDTEAERKINMS